MELKKKSNSKKNGEDHTCLGWKGNQKTLGQRKKQTETNEYMVAQRKKKKIECHMKPKNQQENEEYNEDKKQQIALKEKKLKKKEKRERGENLEQWTVC